MPFLSTPTVAGGSRLTRRAALAALAAGIATAAVPAAAVEDALAALEARSGGRLGVLVQDTGSGRTLAHRADERFLLCSTAKLASVAAVLARVDAGAERLDRRISYAAGEIDVGYAPDTRGHLAEGGMSVEALCRAAMVHSDNGAANLLVASLGGPADVTAFVRGLGDATTRFDRTEPTLNHPDGDRDTATPRAFAATVRALLLGPALSPPSRALLDRWMADCATGLARLRAGVPKDWGAGDKTGTAGALCNDVALFRPPGRAPIVAVAFSDVPDRTDAERESLLRDVGTVAVSLAG